MHAIFYLIAVVLRVHGLHAKKKREEKRKSQVCFPAGTSASKNRGPASAQLKDKVAFKYIGAWVPQAKWAGDRIGALLVMERVFFRN